MTVNKKKPAAESSRLSRILCHFTALLFSFFMVFGRSFALTDSWDLVFGSLADGIFSLIQGLFWYLLFLLGITFLFRFTDRVDITKEFPGKPSVSRFRLVRAIQPLFSKYCDALYRAPMRVTFLTLTLVNIPNMIWFYPAVFMGDTPTQFPQAMGLTGLTNHHPVAHTLLLSLFGHIGQWIQNDNFGIFLYCLTQMTVLFLVIAYLMRTLVQLKVNRIFSVSLLVYYCIHPRISPYLFIVIKDILYTSFLVLFYLLFFRLLRNGENKRKRDYVLFGISAAGMILMRNDGQYILLLTLLLALFYRPFRKAAVLGLGVVATVFLGLNAVLFPLLDVEPGSPREMLSVPFQQTARCVRDVGDELTKDQIAAIDGVLDYDTIGEVYDPDLSDPVKSTFHGDKQSFLSYMKAWLEMLFQYPDIYIQATMNNYYIYFYPGEERFDYFGHGWGQTKMEQVNDLCGTDFFMPESLSSLRDNAVLLRERIFTLPGLSILNTPALYTWAAILFLVYSLRKKSFVSFLYGMPMLVQLLIFITGPTNGAYCRYEYPMLIYMPAVLLLGLKLIRETAKEKKPVKKA